MADSVILGGQALVPEGSSPSSSTYLQIGFFQSAVLRLIEYYQTPHAACAEFNWEDYMEISTTSIASYLLNATKDTSYPLDRLSTGKGLLYQYGRLNTKVELESLHALRESINLQPRNAFGGYWYFTYPNWSYLDGIYSLIPFLLSYTPEFNPQNRTVQQDVVHQLDLLWRHCYHQNSGLLVHGYDASKTASWANPLTGASPVVWGRSMGWYTMTLVDALELSSTFPPSMFEYIHRRLGHLSTAVISAADNDTGCWWQVMDSPDREGNYIESSGSAMFTTALFRAARLGYLSDELASEARNIATKCYRYLVDNFVVQKENGTLGYNGTVSVCSLNSSASYDYYVSQPILYDSLHGMAAFVQASLEQEMLNTSTDNV
ncbi:uncharacterized protein N7483_012474 [Penicillium malachiteum]|uniref:uncharacterized protein n=1 Tax=Penicillium malachiteum TaxID=1324776 RepID=UPI00254790CA|nr:uncharacterized protein N7483_012474 [Penicillium malachiteum]KAJ5715293.1 hypothetical protein N7483_012474 [Penicillium malachiteum]